MISLRGSDHQVHWVVSITKISDLVFSSQKIWEKWSLIDDIRLQNWNHKNWRSHILDVVEDKEWITLNPKRKPAMWINIIYNLKNDMKLSKKNNFEYPKA